MLSCFIINHKHLLISYEFGTESNIILKNYLLNILRWGIRVHGISHVIEVVSAINEEAYITATIAFIFIVIEVLASFVIPNEHVHFKPLKSEVHTLCDDRIENIENGEENN